MNFISRVVAMGQRVEKKIDAAGDVNRLPEFLEEEFEADDIAQYFEMGKFAEELLDFDLPRQLDNRGTFGQPAITLYEDSQRRFIIEIYVWQNVDTAIHDHGFCGAGKVILGRSLESLFRFDAGEPVSDLFRIGKLEVAGSRVMEKGDIFRFFARTNYIHQVHHLSTPTLSLIGRTFGAQDSQQNVYLFPGMSLGREAVAGLGVHHKKRMEIHQVLRSQQHPFESDYLRGLMLRTKGHLLWPMFLQFLLNAPNLAEVEEVVSLLEKKYGAWARVFEGMALHYLPDYLMTTAKPREQDEHLYLNLLSLWGLGPKTNEILEKIYPGRDAETTISDCTQRLCKQRGLNSKWLRALADVNKNPGLYTSAQLKKRHALNDDELRMLQKFNVGKLIRTEESFRVSSHRENVREQNHNLSV